MLFLPFAIISDKDDNIWEATILVFLVTYGFMGLTLAEIEMHVSTAVAQQILKWNGVQTHLVQPSHGISNFLTFFFRFFMLHNGYEGSARG